MNRIILSTYVPSLATEEELSLSTAVCPWALTDDGSDITSGEWGWTCGVWVSCEAVSTCSIFVWTDGDWSWSCDGWNFSFGGWKSTDDISDSVCDDRVWDGDDCLFCVLSENKDEN